MQLSISNVKYVRLQVLQAL